MLASCPASILNQNPTDSGIPNRFTPDESHSSVVFPQACLKQGDENKISAQMDAIVGLETLTTKSKNQAPMIISHECKFIFLRTKKTASTTVELVLSQLCGADDIITPLSEIDEAERADGRGAQNWQLHGLSGFPRLQFKRPKDYGYRKHMPAAMVRARLGDAVWRSYFKFAFDRNPWDRQVSLYYFRYRNEQEPPTFTTFIHKDPRARVKNYDIYSIDGDMAVDFVGRFENLEEDIKLALDRVGLSLAKELPRAKTTFRRGTLPYRDYYDDDMRDIVGRWYAREIDLLKYEF
jgi:hypothetical protein